MVFVEPWQRPRSCSRTRRSRGVHARRACGACVSACVSPKAPGARTRPSDSRPAGPAPRSRGRSGPRQKGPCARLRLCAPGRRGSAHKDVDSPGRLARAVARPEPAPPQPAREPGPARPAGERRRASTCAWAGGDNATPTCRGRRCRDLRKDSSGERVLRRARTRESPQLQGACPGSFERPSTRGARDAQRSRDASRGRAASRSRRFGVHASLGPFRLM